MTEDNGGSEGKGPKLTEKEVPATHSEKEWLKIWLQRQVRIGLRRTKHLAFFFLGSGAPITFINRGARRLPL